MIRYLILALFFTNSLSLASNHKIKQKISNLYIANKDVSIIVQGVNDAKPIVSINPNTLRNPASVNKILTTYASLLKLGDNYRWPTKFYIRGKLNKGTLKGDLIVKGYGNPDLRTEDLSDIVLGLKKKGIKHIKGNLIIDETHFNVSSTNWTYFDKNTYSPYNATPSAFMFNHHATSLLIKGDRKKNKVRVYRDIPDYSYSVVNKIKPVKTKCKGRYANPRINIKKGKKVTVIFSGKLSSRCKSIRIYKVLTTATRSFYAALKQEFTKKGGSLNGKLLIMKKPKDAKIIYIHKSEKLIDIIAKINKKSNNVMAKQTLLTIGTKHYGKPATIKSGAKAVKSILRKHNLVDKSTKIDNGSGLSRTAKINANSLVKLLKHGYKSDYKWMNTLSIMGKDGTLKNRLKRTKLKNNAWLKTGSLKNVKAVAGYVKAKTGKVYIVVMIVNSNKSSLYPAIALQDYLLKWVYG